MTWNWFMKNNVSLSGSFMLYLSWLNGNLFVCEGYVICRFFWDRIYYNTSHGMLVSGSQWFQVYLKTWWLLRVCWVPFGTYPDDLLVCICQNCLLDTAIFCSFSIIIIGKQDFTTMILNILRKFLDTTTILNNIMSGILVPPLSWYCRLVWSKEMTLDKLKLKHLKRRRML